MSHIKDVLIVGGGSSGWMTASLLSKRLPAIDITLLEAAEIPTLGVGESTNGIMRHFQRQIGLTDETEFMRSCNSAFKLAIRFENFNRKGGIYFHPFGKGETDGEDGMFKAGAETLFPNFHLAREGTQFSKEYFYAYQLDANLYGRYLKEKCLPRGIRHLVGAVRGVVRLPDGSVDHIETEHFGALRADLFIDCSGFRSALLGKAFNEPFNEVSPYLINDRAIAARIPYRDKERQLRTYTNCTGLTAGWAWEIPLWSRIGGGYVYSSAFLSRNDAEEEYREFLGREQCEGMELRHIEIRAGRHTRAWVENCVGIGTSYGFLEPLESTGLSLTQLQILDLADALHSMTLSGVERALFNRRCGHIFDTTRDFIIAHYVLTARDDTPYWRHHRYDVALPDSLLDTLAHFRAKSTFPFTREVQTFYQAKNWNTILSGMGFFDKMGMVKGSAIDVTTSNHSAFLARTVYEKVEGQLN